MMLNIATNYRNGNTNLNCPLCEETENTQSHMTYCREYTQLTTSLYTDNLFSSKSDNYVLKVAVNVSF